MAWPVGYGFDLVKYQHMASDGVAVIALILVSTPVQVSLLFCFSRPRSSSAVEYLGLTPPRKRDLVLLPLVGAALLATTDGTNWFLGEKIVTAFQDDISRSGASAGALAWLWLAVVVVAPIGEEVLFRGFLFQGWRRSPDDVWIAVVGTAILWAAIHVQYNIFVVGEIFLIGLALGWVRWRTGSAISTILLHAFLNSAGMVETYFQLGG